MGDGRIIDLNSGTWGDGNVAILLEVTNGDGSKFVALYGHVFSAFPENTEVVAGQQIGTVGNNPGFGEHLHFGLHPGAGVPGGTYGTQSCDILPNTQGWAHPYEYLGSHSPAGGGGGTTTTTEPPPPPVTISGSKSPASTSFGWNNTDVTVSFTCGGGKPPLACTDPQTISAEGEHTVNGSVSDQAGQSESTSVAVKIDKTKPTATIGTSSSANDSGWFNSTPTLTGTCTDDRSGIDTCSTPSLASGSFVGSLTRTAKDKAGNTDSASIDVKIDTKPPTITPSMIPELNEHGWSQEDDRIVVFFECEDPLENGVASGMADDCPVRQAVLKVGETPITVSAHDIAGNETTITTYVRIDRTAPTLVIVPDREPDTKEGWYTDPVTLTGECDDTESPILDCTEETVEEDGVHTVWLFAENAADFLTSRKTTIKMDMNGPEIEPVFTGTMGSEGYFTSNVQVSFVCTDAGIGVKTCPKKKSITKDGVTYIEATAIDKLGHESTIAFEVIVDKTKPKGTITKFTKNTVAPGGVIKGTMGDAFSGVDMGWLEITNSNGTALVDVVKTCNSGRTSCTWTANVSQQIGAYTAKLVVLDDAGNVFRTSPYRFTVK